MVQQEPVEIAQNPDGLHHRLRRQQLLEGPPQRRPVTAPTRAAPAATTLWVGHEVAAGNAVFVRHRGR